MDVLGVDTDGLGSHLREDRVGTLADLGGAHLELHRAVLVERHAGRCRLERERRDGRLVHEERDAHAVADGVGLVCVLALLLVPVNPLLALLHALRERAGVGSNGTTRRELVHEALADAVLEAELDAVPVVVMGDVAHEALGRPDALWHAVGAHGTRVRAVGVDGPGLAAGGNLVGVVEPAERVHRVEHQRVTVVDVAAGVGPAADGARVQEHVVAIGGLDVEGLGLASRGVPEELLARELEANATATNLLADPGVQRLVVDVLLGAKAAADVGLDHAHVAPGDAQGLADHAAHDVRDLGGGHADDLAALHVAERGAGLDVDLGLLARLGVDGDVVVRWVVDGVVHRLIAVLGQVLGAREGAGVGHEVIGLDVLHRVLGALERLLGIVDDGPLLVLDLNLAKRAVARNGVLGNDHGDVVTVDADAVVEELPVRKVALLGVAVGVPGVTGHGIGPVGHVEAGEDRHHAGDLLGLRGVHRDDPTVADRGVEDPRLKAGLGAEVVGEHGTSRDLVVRVDARDGTSDLPQLFHDSSLF